MLARRSRQEQAAFRQRKRSLMKEKLLFALALFFRVDGAIRRRTTWRQAAQEQKVTIPNRIWIDRKREDIVPWICDYMNDHNWRLEVKDMIVPLNEVGLDPAAGNTYLEIADLGRIVPHIRRYQEYYFNTTVKLMDLNLPSQCRAETPPENGFYLESNREFEDKDGGTEFSYKVTMSSGYAYDLFGVPLPDTLAYLFSRLFLTLNLKKLKVLLESENPPV